MKQSGEAELSATGKGEITQRRRTARRSQDSITFLEKHVQPFPESTFVQICAIGPDGESVLVQSAPVAEVEQLRSFVEEHQDDKNIYFGINPLKRSLDKKASKDDISHACYFQADIDPAPSKPLDAERKRIRAEIDRARLKPTIVIDSGGGFQVLYCLAQPIHVNGNASELERGSKALERLLGADHCSNIDRIFRLPGTMNYPNAKKRAAGRQPAPARLVSFDERLYNLEDFGGLVVSAPKAGDGNEPIKITREVEIRCLDVEQLDVSPAIRRLIRTGQSPERSYPSRSEALFAAVGALRRVGYDDGTIFSVCLDRQNGISAHPWKDGDQVAAIRAVDRVLNKIDADAPVDRAVDAKLAKLTATVVITATDFVRKRLPPRRQIIDTLLPERSMVLVSGAKSVGKTWLALSLLGAVAQPGSGKTFLGFKVEGSRRCLYVDGEMVATELQERLRTLFGSDVPAKLDVMPSEFVREVVEGPLCINDPSHQQAFFRLLAELEAAGRRPEVIAFDNLSTLTRHMEENSNSGEMDNLIEFFLTLRHAGYAVICLHHLGKAGDQRGGNRKEDPVDLSIVLSRLSKQQQNAAFRLWIKDIRGVRPKPDRFTCELSRDPGSGLPEWRVESMPESRGWVATLVGIANLNPEAQKDLVNLLGISKSVASKHVKALRSKGLVAESSLTLTPKGKAYLETVAKRRGDVLAGAVSEDEA